MTHFFASWAVRSCIVALVFASLEKLPIDLLVRNFHSSYSKLPSNAQWYIQLNKLG